MAPRITLTPPCHPERSEGSHEVGVEMLRSAQHDNVVIEGTALTLALLANVLYSP